MTEIPTESGHKGAWSKLRSRKVVQWAIAYAAFAWGLLQCIGFVADAFAWPSSTKQIATLAFLIGLPIALVLAWYHGDRGQQRVSPTELAILTVIFLAGGGFLWRYQRAVQSPPSVIPPAATSASATATDARPSIAVLPFDNRSQLDDDASFVDGIHDDILTQISKVSGLKVIARTSVERFRNGNSSVQEIAAQLGVTNILAGGVQRVGERVRIRVQLIDASTQSNLWAESYDRKLTAANIFAIQSDVAGAIASALKTALTPAEQARTQVVPTESLDAWEAYQLGQQRTTNRTAVGLKDAEQFFRKAIDLDPKFALAWVGLANTLTWQVVFTGLPQDAAFGEAEQAVGRAMELDPNLAEAWASAGYLEYTRLGRSPGPTESEWEGAEQKLRRAISLNPNYALAYDLLSLVLDTLDRRDEALAMAERAVALDPLSAVNNNRLGDIRANLGRFDEALVAYGRAIEIDPSIAVAYGNIGGIHWCGFGRIDTALPWLEKAASLDPEAAWTLGNLTLINLDLGADDEAKRWLDRALALGTADVATNSTAAYLYLGRGDAETAHRYAQLAADEDPYYLFMIRSDDVRKGDYATARARYAEAYPELFEEELPTFHYVEASAAIDLALVLQHTGERERANLLLDASDRYIRTIPRLGVSGYGLADVTIRALRGNKAEALAKLREAGHQGWRCWWRYYRDFEPNLESIRNEPEFKAVFADIERDMAEQRARLTARPKDAPLELSRAR